ncbi:MAG: recombinase family protein [Candidatus Competibacter sp.]
MRVAILARVSTEGQENEGESLVVQQKRLQECVASLNGTVVKVYSGQESATSGKKARPILDQLLEDSATGVFDAIMVYDMSRFSRDPVKSKISLGILKRNGIKLYIQNQLYDLDNLETNLIVGILNEINSFSAAIQARKSVESKIERARRGFPSSGGRLPFG